MENSEILLQYALNAMKEAGLPDGVWSIGGGTVLAAYYNHRLSKDIDIFITLFQSSFSSNNHLIFFRKA